MLMLGFVIDASIFVEGKWRAESEPKLDPIEVLYVYYVVVDHKMVGNVVTPLLRTSQTSRIVGRRRPLVECSV